MLFWQVVVLRFSYCRCAWSACKLAKLIHDDIQSLVDIDGGQDLLQVLDRRTPLLFLHTDCEDMVYVRERIVSMDLQVLRSTAFTVSIPPPSSLCLGMLSYQTSTHTHMQHGSDDGLAEQRNVKRDVQQFPCLFVYPDGRHCGTVCISSKQRSLHMRHTHGRRNILRTLTVTNQCIMCLSSFRTREIAVRHIIQSVARNCCITDRSVFNWPVSCPRFLECPPCFCSKGSLEELT